jgi:hypothetical protein
MLTVLWILTVGSSIALAAVLRGRAGADASRNRMAIELAAWSAAGCAARVLGALDGRFRDARSSGEREVAWLQLDRIAEEETIGVECGVTLEPLGVRLPVNGASVAQLRALFSAAGIPHEAPHIADAVEEWRAVHGDIEAIEQLTELRALGARPELLDLLTVDSDPVALTHAPRPVLAAVPGMSPAMAELLLAHRRTQSPIYDLRNVVGPVAMSFPEGMSRLLQAVPAQAALTPVGWRLTVATSAGHPPVTRFEEWRIGRQAARLAVTARRVR